MSKENIVLTSEASAAAPGAKKPKAHRFITNTFTVLAAQAGRVLATLLLEIVYARLLGPAGRGQMSLCMMVVGFGVLVGGLGCDVPIMIWSADKRLKPSEWLPSVLTCGLFGSLLAMALWSLLSFWWHPAFLRGITNQLAMLLVICIPLSVLGSFGLALLVGLERLKERSVLVVLSQVITMIAAVG